MRRTLWVVALDLAAVVDAACTRAVAARERAKLEQFVAQSGLADDPAVWIDRAAAAALDALSERGEAFTSDLTRADPLLATKIRLGAGTRWEAEVSAASRVLPLLAAEGRIVRGRPRGRWTHGQYRWALAPGRDAELDTATAQAELLRRWLGAFGPATETDIRWWTGWTAREARAALAAVPHAAVDLDGDIRARPRGRPRSRRRARAVGRAPADARPDDDGLEGARLVSRPARRDCSSTGTGTPARPSGGTAASSAAGRSGRTGRSSSASSRTSVRTACGPSKPRRPASLRGSGTSASRRDSCPRSSARSRPERGVAYPSPRKISFAITRRWICDVPS